MTPKGIDAKRVSPRRAPIYWDKAKDFYKLMLDAADKGNWNGAGLAAVHCAISATDALLVARAGRRSSAKAHEDVADLVTAHIRHPQTSEQVKRLRRILNQKNLIEYIDRFFERDEALELQKQAERYFGWVQSLLNF